MNKELEILLKSIGNPLINNGDPIALVESKDILNLAFKNNVEIEYLEKLKSNNLLNELESEYTEFHERLADTAKCIKRITHALEKNDIPYALTKTFLSNLEIILAINVRSKSSNSVSVFSSLKLTNFDKSIHSTFFIT